ncbi:hypothetical protein Pmani_015945 [Petrolisthes manimaculis]|uniref:Uncharacterized protein n=1 Tax=Petrolisthes manimaculis TaxID=1843537 RepID=A0AAE1UBJ2_9EUCA|nr:hypothetical protein Pmani_015945 [Petrolisthes manimaculis]
MESPSSSADTDNEDKSEKKFIFKSRRNLPKHSTPVNSSDNQYDRTETCTLLSFSDNEFEPCNFPAQQYISDDSEESCIPPTPQIKRRYSVINPPTPQPQHISDDSEESCNFPTPQQEPVEDSDTGQQVAYYDSDDSDTTHVDTQILVNVGYLETDTTLEADDEHSSDTDNEDTYENWCRKYNKL